MSRVETLEYPQWDSALAAGDTLRVTDALECGQVLLLPRLAFELTPDEKRFLSPRWSDGKAKNISYNPLLESLKGAAPGEPDTGALKAMMARYARNAQAI